MFRPGDLRLDAPRQGAMLEILEAPEGLERAKMLSFINLVKVSGITLYKAERRRGDEAERDEPLGGVGGRRTSVEFYEVSVQTGAIRLRL